MPFYANISASGSIRFLQVPFSVGVLESPSDKMPVGAAHPMGRSNEGLELWRVEVGGHELPGRFVIVDRVFTAIGA